LVQSYVPGSRQPRVGEPLDRERALGSGAAHAEQAERHVLGDDLHAWRHLEQVRGGRAFGESVEKRQSFGDQMGVGARDRSRRADVVEQGGAIAAVDPGADRRPHREIGFAARFDGPEQALLRGKRIAVWRDRQPFPAPEDLLAENAGHRALAEGGPIGARAIAAELARGQQDERRRGAKHL
jgi:hypothetical protein